MKNMSRTQQRVISGNGMHLHVLGAVLMFLMSHVRRVQSANDCSESLLDI